MGIQQFHDVNSLALCPWLPPNRVFCVCLFLFLKCIFLCVGNKGTSGAQDFVELELKAIVSNSTFLWRVGSTSKH